MYLVVFRNRKRADIDQGAYTAQAERMEYLARQQPGFLAFKSYAAADGEVVALSEWADEAAARACEAEHRLAQADGRALWCDSYTLFACDSPRVHQFTAAD